MATTNVWFNSLGVICELWDGAKIIQEAPPYVGDVIGPKTGIPGTWRCPKGSVVRSGSRKPGFDDDGSGRCAIVGSTASATDPPIKMHLLQLECVNPQTGSSIWSPAIGSGISPGCVSKPLNHMDSVCDVGKYSTGFAAFLFNTDKLILVNSLKCA